MAIMSPIATANTLAILSKVKFLPKIELEIKLFEHYWWYYLGTLNLFLKHIFTSTSFSNSTNEGKIFDPVHVLFKVVNNCINIFFINQWGQIDPKYDEWVQIIIKVHNLTFSKMIISKSFVADCNTLSPFSNLIKSMCGQNLIFLCLYIILLLFLVPFLFIFTIWSLFWNTAPKIAWTMVRSYSKNQLLF